MTDTMRENNENLLAGAWWVTKFARLVLIILLFRLLVYTGCEIRVVEEVAEEDEVAEVHEQGELDVLVGHVTLQAGLFHLDHPKVDQATHDHLNQLQGSDHHRYRTRNSEPEKQ